MTLLSSWEGVRRQKNPENLDHAPHQGLGFKPFARDAQDVGKMGQQLLPLLHVL